MLPYAFLQGMQARKQLPYNFVTKTLHISTYKPKPSLALAIYELMNVVIPRFGGQ